MMSRFRKALVGELRSQRLDIQARNGTGDGGIMRVEMDVRVGGSRVSSCRGINRWEGYMGWRLLWNRQM